MNTYRLDSALPLRAYGNSALLIIVGAVLLALATGLAWHGAVVVIAVIILVLGAILLTLSIFVTFRGRVRVSLDDDGYRLLALGKSVERDWTDIALATMTDTELRLYPRDEERPDVVPMMHPSHHRELDRLSEDVTDRMRRAYGRLG